MQETRLSGVSPVPRFELILSRLQGRLQLEYQRLALSWHAMRDGRGRAVRLQRDGGLIRVHDGMRQIAVPHVRYAAAFRNGVNDRLESVAEKYLGGTGFVPREGDVIVDVGAGIGEFALWCADKGARVVAFEPDPLAFACLGQNSFIQPAISILPYALWKEHVDLRLHGSLDTRESSLIEDGRPNTRTADVEAWPLDQLPFMAQLAVIDLMKVDGEGVEPEILAGAERTLRRTRVLAVDVSAIVRRPNLRARVEAALEHSSFRPLANDRPETILAVNTAMVGPFSNRVLGRRGS
jgi:FkbM family methyltransferase